jgi:hypothetical protein
MTLMSRTSAIPRVTETLVRTRIGRPQRWNSGKSTRENFAEWKRIGRAAEAERFPEWEAQGFETEVWLGRTATQTRGNRTDGIKFEEIPGGGLRGILRQLKPNTPSGRARGLRDLARHLEAAKEFYKKDGVTEWGLELELYYSITLVTYEVQQGETLSEISQRFGLSVETIAQANDIKDPNKIFVGQKIVLDVILKEKGKLKEKTQVQQDNTKMPPPRDKTKEPPARKAEPECPECA